MLVAAANLHFKEQVLVVGTTKAGRSTSQAGWWDSWACMLGVVPSTSAYSSKTLTNQLTSAYHIVILKIDWLMACNTCLVLSDSCC